jgi:hypothetical protein
MGVGTLGANIAVVEREETNVNGQFVMALDFKPLSASWMLLAENGFTTTPDKS